MTGTGADGSPAHRSPRLVFIVAIVGAALVAVALLRQPGSTPLRLSVSSPADNARLDSAPPAVTLQFSGATQLAIAHVAVEDARGARVSYGDAEISGSRVSQPMTAAGAGLFQVGFHVVSSDGAESAGVLRFTVGTSPEAGPAPPAPDASVGHVHLTKDPLSLLLVLIDLVLVVVLLVAMLRRRPTVRR